MTTQRKTAMLVYGMGEDWLEVERLRSAMNAFARYFPGQGGHGRALLWIVRNRTAIKLTRLPDYQIGSSVQYSIRLESPAIASYVHTGLHNWARALNLYAGESTIGRKVSIGMLLRSIANHEPEICALLEKSLGAALAANGH